MAETGACLPYDALLFAAGVFFFGGADFFFAKRLFFRYGEGGEGRASRATVGVTAKDNGGACFPLDFGITPTKGRQPSHPHRSGFFCSFHATCVPTCEWLATTDPPKLIAPVSRAPSGASGCAFACMELSTICHLRWRVCRHAARLFVLFHTTRSISPGTIPAHQSSAIKRAVQKNATLQKSGVRYFSA